MARQPVRRTDRRSPLWPVLAALGLAAALAGCAAPDGGADRAPAPAAAGAATLAPFDEPQSAQLLAQAEAAEDRGDLEDARRLYEQAALLWPDRQDAWRRLADLAETRERREAADFVAERVTLYPSDALFVQREVSRVVDLYVTERAALPEANETKLAYLRRLADFYRHLYAERGQYEPLTPFWEL